MLSKRLKTLERAAVVTRTEIDGRTSYSLTECGQELAGVVAALNTWGTRWVGELGDDDLDPHLLMWDMRRTVPIDEWPRARTVVEFHLAGVAPKVSRWWMVVAEGHADVCDFDPGFDVTATVDTSLRALTEVWRGDTSWSRALLEGEIALSGPTDIRRLIPAWFGQGRSAGIARPA